MFARLATLMEEVLSVPRAYAWASRAIRFASRLSFCRLALIPNQLLHHVVCSRDEQNLCQYEESIGSAKW